MFIVSIPGIFIVLVVVCIVSLVVLGATLFSYILPIIEIIIIVATLLNGIFTIKYLFGEGGIIRIILVIGIVLGVSILSHFLIQEISVPFSKGHLITGTGTLFLCGSFDLIITFVCNALICFLRDDPL